MKVETIVSHNPLAIPLAGAFPCGELPVFTADWEGIRRAFQNAPPLALRQSWRETEEPGFAPGSVRIGWREQSLLVFAELSGNDIFTQATAHNQRLWELGDAFEIFLQQIGQPSYVEFQIAPNNLRLQLRYPHAAIIERTRRTGDLQPYVIPGEAFHSATWVRPAEKKWFAFATIGIGLNLSGGATDCPWRFSFARYQHPGGRREPVISSTSPHVKADFHRQAEWGTLCFQRRF